MVGVTLLYSVSWLVWYNLFALCIMAGVTFLTLFHGWCNPFVLYIMVDVTFVYSVSWIVSIHDTEYKKVTIKKLRNQTRNLQFLN